jgi:hypothetical protein
MTIGPERIRHEAHLASATIEPRANFWASIIAIKIWNRGFLRAQGRIVIGQKSSS